MKFSAIVFSFLLGLGLSAFAQQPISPHPILAEKIRITDLKQWHQAALRASDTPQMGGSSISREDITAGESRIGVTQKPEAEIAAAISPIDSNHLVACAMRYDPFAQIEPLSFTVYFSQDFGEMWSESSFTGHIQGNAQNIGGGDPVLQIDQDGRVHLVWVAVTANEGTLQGKVGIYYATSDNFGLNWDIRPQPIIAGNITAVLNSSQIIPTDILVDKPALVIDRRPGPDRNRLYALYYEEAVIPGQKKIMCQRKGRQQSTFSSPVNVSGSWQDIQFVQADVDQAGHLHVVFWATFNATQYALYYTRSENAGQSFSPAQKVTDVNFPPRDPATGFYQGNIVGMDRLYPCPQIKADTSGGAYDGRIYVSWTGRGIDSMTTPGMDIYLTHSDDGGQNWAEARIVNDDGLAAHHQYYSSLSVSPKGVVSLGWYDRREDLVNNVQTHYYHSYSLDGGLTFPMQSPLSTQETNFATVYDRNEELGIGEYMTTLSSRGYALPFWSDGRENNGRLHVYMAKVPLAGQVATSLSTISSVGDISLDILNRNDPSQIDIRLGGLAVGAIEAVLLGLDGKQLAHWPLQATAAKEQYSLSLPPLATGTYILGVLTPKGRVYRRLRRW